MLLRDGDRFREGTGSSSISVEATPLSTAIGDDDILRASDPLDVDMALAVKARDLTQAFLQRHGPTLIDPDKIAGKYESAARFRHDLRAKLSMLQTIIVSIDKNDQSRRELQAQLEDLSDGEDRQELSARLVRCEETIGAACENVPDVIDEFLPETPDIDSDLTSGYQDFLDCLHQLRDRLLRT